MSTKVKFSNMLKEVVKQPNSSRAKKHIKMKAMGMKDDDIRGLLDKQDAFELQESGKEESYYLDTADAKTSVKTSEVKAKKPKGKFKATY